MGDKIARQVHAAARQKNTSKLSSLLQTHPEALEVENNDGEAPLVTAAVEGNVHAVQLLLNQGADPCRQKGFALTCACYHGHDDVVQALIHGGADVVVREVPRWHGLHAACGWGDASKPNARVVELLLEAGANSKRKFLGSTPLQYAKAADQQDIVALLKQHNKSKT